MKIKNVYIIAGPNGSGKTTFAKTFLPEYAKCERFINADLIAAGLSPFSPQQVAIKSGKLVLGQIREYSESGVDFGFETTMSGVTYLKYFKMLKEKGYKIHTEESKRKISPLGRKLSDSQKIKVGIANTKTYTDGINIWNGREEIRKYLGYKSLFVVKKMITNNEISVI